MDRPTLTNRFSPHRLTRLAELALLLVLLTLPLLAVYQTARQLKVVEVLSGDSVTLHGRTSQGTEVTVTSYPAVEVGPPAPVSPVPAADPGARQSIRGTTASVTHVPGKDWTPIEVR